MSVPDLDFNPRRGLSEDILREISWMKGEPDWMLEHRLKAYAAFEKHPMPSWGGDTSGIVFDNIVHYPKTSEGQVDPWAEGSTESERKRSVGIAARHESEVAFRRHREDLEKQGVLFTDMDTALREYPELVKPYFGTIIPPNDNKFAALNTSVWSGGSFIYVPPGVEVDLPLQAYFRVRAENMGQFERTLIIADEGSKVQYIEGCSAPVYSSDSLHSAVVEVVVKPDAHVTHTTIQNWSSNVFNLVTKRAWVEAEGSMEWIDGNIGSRLTMTYPTVCLAGPKATGQVLSVACAGNGQHQDTGARMMHLAPETTSSIVSKSVSKDGGRSSYRGLVRVEDDVGGCKSHLRCDALILDDDSVFDSDPSTEIGSADVQIDHDTAVSKVADVQLFYLMSRGLSEEQAIGMVVNGFVEPVTRMLPLEYAVEWSRLIELQMEGSIG